jgi:hypothetical protein
MVVSGRIIEDNDAEEVLERNKEKDFLFWTRT